jgi:transcriptional regulator with XRE-family HTH domain
MPSRRKSHSDSIVLLARALQGLRTRAKLTQSEMARRMGTTQTAIARLESGGQNPTFNTVEGYARAAGFDLEINFVPRPEAPDPAEERLAHTEPY